MNTHYPFSLQPLPYSFHALQPFLNRETVCNHYEHHHRNYVNRLNQLLLPYPSFHSWTLEQLLTESAQLPAEIRSGVLNNAGGVYNHNLYWNSMTPHGHCYPVGTLAQAINRQYSSFAIFQQQFKNNAMAITGSGWTWLIADGDGELTIINTANQQVPDLQQVIPLLVLDIWEHAHYLQYRYNRERYIENWWNLVNWNHADALYRQCMTA